MKVAAHIPIKSHSSRLERKNFRQFNGKPLYHWVFHTLEQVDIIDEIYINTNSEQVMEEAPELFDVEIIEREERFCTPDVSLNDIFANDIGEMSADIYLHTYCTSPLITPSTFENAITSFLDDDSHDSLMSVTEHQSWYYDSNFEPINHTYEEVEDTQDLEPVYEENGILYVLPHETAERLGRRIGDNPMHFEMPPIEELEIDYQWEFELAEASHREREIRENILTSHRNK